MGLMHTLLLSCRKATLLMEHRSMVPLNATERMQLWMHTRICTACRVFAAQSALIDTLAEDRGAHGDIDHSSLEERILKNIPGPSRA
ncbi:MAG: hypothetical protein ABI373_09590 [Flavobacteriales bacterium]